MSNQPSALAPAVHDARSRLPAGAFRRACRQLGVSDCLEQAILVSDRAIVAGQSRADAAQVERIAEYVRSTCEVSSPAIQIQYTALDDASDGRLLYVKPLDDFLLVLVAGRDTAVSRLRRLADGLSKSLGQGGGGQKTLSEQLAKFDQGSHGHRAMAPPETEEAETVYAIAWRPVEPLPLGMRKIIRESAQRLARREGCQLNFIGVASDHVHLVLECPPRRKGAWAAYAFKRGIEEDIADRYGTSASLWQKGFLADLSASPLGGEELLAYLNH